MRTNVGVGTVREISSAYKHFIKATKKEPKLGLLFLIDPIMAFADSGIELSKSARKKMRSTLPARTAKTSRVYNRIKTRQCKPFIKSVKISLGNTNNQ